VPLFEAIRLALAQIRVQKLKSFFTLIGVAIGVMFLIAIVSIINGVGRYVEDDLVGKLITKNSFEVRSRPNIQMGDMDESEWRALRSRPRITEDDIPVVVASLPPSARWSVEGSGSVSVESRYAKPRTLTIQCVDGAWFDTAADEFESRGADKGCAVGAVSLDVRATDHEIRRACEVAFDDWISTIADRLPLRTERDRRSFATATVAAFEGAFVLARATKSGEPFRHAGRWLSLALVAQTTPKSERKPTSRKRR